MAMAQEEIAIVPVPGQSIRRLSPFQADWLDFVVIYTARDSIICSMLRTSMPDLPKSMRSWDFPEAAAFDKKKR